MGKYIKIAITISMGLWFALFSLCAYGAEQQVNLIPSKIELSTFERVRVIVEYSSSNCDGTLTSLGVRIHFDSEKLVYEGFDNLFEKGKLADPQIQEDSENYDGDAKTDKYVLLAYSDPINGNWPDELLPLDLVSLLFKIKADVQSCATRLNVSKVTGHAGYGFSANGTVINVLD
jgi:hypothetical protein